MRGRGTGWVAGQLALMAAVVAAGFLPPHWPASLHGILSVAASMLAVAGAVLVVWAARTLGRSLTPFPKPVGAGLVTSGPFAVVRHPIYTGGLAFFVGYSLYASVPALVLMLLLAVLWAGKIRVEERLLLEAYSGYAAYQKAVRRRLIPFVY
jgi:protein-S-isoprenylcysteine O-methyltransferase Ste14